MELALGGEKDPTLEPELRGEKESGTWPAVEIGRRHTR